MFRQKRLMLYMYSTKNAAAVLRYTILNEEKVEP